MGASLVSYEDREGNNVAVRPNTPLPTALPNVSAFEEIVTAEFTPIIELDSSNGLSPVYRDTTTVTGTGSVTNSSGEHIVATGATASSTADLETKERGRYQAGIVGLPGVAVRRPTAPTGAQEIRWGYYDDTDGFWFGEDATGLFVRLRSGGVDRDKVYQSDWNGDDKLDGNGASGVTLDLTKTQIFRMPFVWYGGGPVEMSALTTKSDGRPLYVVVHRFAAEAGGPIVENPKLPVCVSAENGATASDIKLYVGGRQFAVVGRYRPNRRITPETRSGVSVASGATEPLISFRKKSARVSATKSVKVADFGATSDKAGYLKVYLGASLTGETFNAPSEVAAAETACETDILASAITGGTLAGVLPVGSGAGAAEAAAAALGLDLDFPSGTIVTLAFENTSGTAATVDATFSVREEW